MIPKLLLISLLFIFAFSQSQSGPTTPCRTGIVGGGMSGVYTAWRLATDENSPVDPWEICLFERSAEFGGKALGIGDIGLGVEKWKGELMNELVTYLGIPQKCVYGKEGEEPTVVAQPETAVVVEEETTTVAEAQTAVVMGEATTTVAEAQSAVVMEEETTTVAEAQSAVVMEEATTTVAEAQSAVVMEEATTTVAEAQSAVVMEEATTTVAEAQTAVVTEVTTAAAKKRQQFFDMETATAEEQQTTEQINIPETEQINIPETPEAANQTQEPLDCSKGEAHFFFLRDKLVYKNQTSKEELPFLLSESEDFSEVPDLLEIAFFTVMNETISQEEVDQISSLTDMTEKYSEIDRIVNEIKTGNIMYNDVPIHELSVGYVLLSSMNASREYFEASKHLNEYPHIKALFETSFEVFAVQYIRNLADSGARTVDGYNGIKTIIDVMLSEIEDLGVQLYLNARLMRFDIVDDTILLEFEGIDRPILVEDLILSLNTKTLIPIVETSGSEFISLGSSESLGTLRSIPVIKGAIFYDDAWWRNYDLKDFIYTDTFLERISYHNPDDCKEGEQCPGYLLIENWFEQAKLLNPDIFNPISISTVLSIFSPTNETIESLISQDGDSSQSTEVVVNVTEPQGGQQGEPQPPEEGRPLSPEEEEMQNALLEELAKLSQAHQAYSKFLLDSINSEVLKIHSSLPGFDAGSVGEPTGAIFANWATDPVFNYGVVKGPSSLNLDQYISTMLEPLPGTNVHFINSDYTELTPWDHGLMSSIVSSERVLHNVYGLEKPEWYTDEIYNHYVSVSMEGNITMEEPPEEAPPEETTIALEVEQPKETMVVEEQETTTLIAQQTTTVVEQETQAVVQQETTTVAEAEIATGEVVETPTS